LLPPYAALKPGETVAERGSGGGFDVHSHSDVRVYGLRLPEDSMPMSIWQSAGCPDRPFFQPNISSVYLIGFRVLFDSRYLVITLKPKKLHISCGYVGFPTDLIRFRITTHPLKAALSRKKTPPYPNELRFFLQVYFGCPHHGRLGSDSSFTDGAEEGIRTLHPYGLITAN